MCAGSGHELVHAKSMLRLASFISLADFSHSFSRVSWKCCAMGEPPEDKDGKSLAWAWWKLKKSSLHPLSSLITPLKRHTQFSHAGRSEKSFFTVRPTPWSLINWEKYLHFPKIASEKWEKSVKMEMKKAWNGLNGKLGKKIFLNFSNDTRWCFRLVFRTHYYHSKHLLNNILLPLNY